MDSNGVNVQIGSDFWLHRCSASVSYAVDEVVIPGFCNNPSYDSLN